MRRTRFAPALALLERQPGLTAAEIATATRSTTKAICAFLAKMETTGYARRDRSGPVSRWYACTPFREQSRLDDGRVSLTDPWRADPRRDAEFVRRIAEEALRLGLARAA